MAAPFSAARFLGCGTPCSTRYFSSSSTRAPFASKLRARRNESHAIGPFNVTSACVRTAHRLTPRAGHHHGDDQQTPLRAAARRDRGWETRLELGDALAQRLQFLTIDLGTAHVQLRAWKGTKRAELASSRSPVSTEVAGSVSTRALRTTS